MPTVGGVGSALFAGAAEAAPRGRRARGRRAGRPERSGRAPDPLATPLWDTTRPRGRQRLAAGPPPSLASDGRSAARLAEQPPAPAWPGPRRSRHAQRLGGCRAQEYAGRAGLSPSEPPGPRHSAFRAFSARLRGALEPRFRDVSSFPRQPPSAPPRGAPQHHTC